MITQIQYSVRPVAQKDQQQLANLIHFETHIHRHLDWRPPLDWIGHSPFLVAERNDTILAALVCPPDPPEMAWIRLFAASSDCKLTDAWQALWSVARAQLIEDHQLQVAAIPLQQWFRTLLERSQFNLTHNVVLLLWQRGYKLPKPKDVPITIRPMNFDDLPAVHQVDLSAFGLLWQNSLDSIGLAFRQSAVATVAEDESGLVGYQISTASPMGGHLARLAVRPDAQNQGIGFALLRDLLDQFERRGALRVTVNTQQENEISLALYAKAGFQKTGEMYPVYQYSLVV